MVFNYPTLAEAYKVAALDGLNKLWDIGVRGAGETEVLPCMIAVELARPRNRSFFCQAVFSVQCSVAGAAYLRS
jgi:hypothetical protein